MNRPRPWIKITGGVNALLWRAPLPHRLKKVLSGSIYRNPPMSAKRVVETLDELERAEVVVCCMGGWGIDALVGEQNRKHRDLDLIIERHDRDAALEALAAIGYETWYEQSIDDRFGNRIVVRDRAMRVVDIHPVEFERAELELASGSIGGREVMCLSAGQQVNSHLGFRNRLPHERRRQRSNTEIARRALETESSASE